MARPKKYKDDLHEVRALHRSVLDKSDEIHNAEKELIRLLYQCDQRRTYVRLGYNSLRGYCTFALNFSRTQSQRIATQVRRYEPTFNFLKREDNA